MPQIPNNFGEGGRCLTTLTLTDGTPTLKDVVNGLADDIASIQDDAPATITAPLATAVPASTSPVGTAVPTITSPLGTATPALTYSTPGAQLDDLTMLRTRVDALTTEVAQARSYIESMRGDLVTLRDYMVAARAEITALRAAQTARAGVTLTIEPSADYT